MNNLLVSDLHGTLIDCNEAAVVEATNYALEKHGRKERVDIEYCKMKQGEPWANYFRLKCPDASKAEIRRMVEDAKEFGLKIYPNYVKPMAHTLEVLSEIKRRGDTIVTISSTTYNAFDGYLEFIGIKEFVDHKIGITKEQEGNDNFDVVGYKSEKLKEFLNGKMFEKKAMVGDSELDARVGKRVGLTTFFFNREGRKLEKADKNITDLRDLLSFFYKDYNLEI